MAITSMRDFKKVYNPKLGRYMYQHYSGGKYFRKLQDINPLDFRGITGLGHEPRGKHIEDHASNIEEQAVEIGDAIINRLRLRNNNGKDLHNIQGSGNSDVVRERIKILMGNGLRV